MRKTIMELLAPAGNREKLNTAFHFGADAVYIGGSSFSLRAYADNFDAEGLRGAVEYAHSLNRKAYITVNIYPANRDFGELKEYLKYIESINADGAIVTDAGVITLAQSVAPALPLHLSTQANTTNGYTARFWAERGIKRIVLARELSIDEIKEIRDMLPPSVELECFVHGAMCISYSGRCLLSNYLAERDSNRGECVQACRWSYKLTEASRDGAPLEMFEDERGTYIMNSRDLNMLAHIDKLINAGVHSFKIEGRMKTTYYVANVINAYRRALDAYKSAPSGYNAVEFDKELYKCSNRGYTTGFYLGKNSANVALDNSQSAGDYDFIASVKGYDEEKGLLVEQRNRFKIGDELEILSANAYFNDIITITGIKTTAGESIEDAKGVQQLLYLKTDKRLSEFDLLRRKK
ncbi:MAG: U32 family peptidase [Clostridia bacterium]|nr:U32 family peptidase [Clostridia bacterium]